MTARILVAGLPPDIAGWLARRVTGAAVEEAGSPAEVADALARDRWSLVVVDATWMEAPVRSALEALRARGSAPPLIVVAPPTHREAEVAGRILADAGTRILRHPLDRDALVREALAAVGPARPGTGRDGPPAASPGSSAVAAAVAGVWARYRDAILARVDSVEAAALGQLEGRLDPEARRAAEREAHRLAGAVGTFGFARASQLARDAEILLGGTQPLGQGDALRLADLAVGIRRELTTPVPDSVPRPDAANSGTAGDALLVCAATGDAGERVAMEAAGRRIPHRVVRSREEVMQAFGAEVPAVVLLDLAFDGGRGMAILREIAERFPPTPVVVTASGDDLADRVEVARLGGRAFLRGPVPPERAMDAVEEVVARARSAGSTVLAVDDDPAVLDAVRGTLEPAGIRVETLSDPNAFWTTLEAVDPRAVLLDVDMPGIDGLELCSVLRSDPRWRTIPVLFLTGRADAETLRAVFAAGADDYVHKPFVGPELLARLENRLERVRLQQAHAETDALTGIPNRRGSEALLDRFLRLARAQEDRVAFGVLDLDRFKAVNDRYGHAVGDEVLARVARLLQHRFRAQDVVARWGGEEFVVAMYGMDRSDGVQRLAEALEALRDETLDVGAAEPLRVTFSAGVAEFPGDGVDLPALYRAADAALYAAKEHGRDRVLPVGWTPDAGDGPRTIDVLIVEDDPAVAALLEHALETRGYRHEWVDTGSAAVERLVGDPARVRARVVLLDVDLPGLDGHGVLRALGRAGVLDRTRVIMLTVRTQESEVLAALENGAFDHVAKPFSVPILLQRVRSALRA